MLSRGVLACFEWPRGSSGLSNVSSPQVVVLATLGLRKWRQCEITSNLLMKINSTQHLAFIMEVM
jgi:hypothetical protein